MFDRCDAAGENSGGRMSGAVIVPPVWSLQRGLRRWGCEMVDGKGDLRDMGATKGLPGRCEVAQ